MLPFLKNKQRGVAGLIIKNRMPSEKTEGGEVKQEPSIEHLACALDLLKAIENKDPKAIAEALYNAFTIMDSEPHEEGEHLSPHSYDAQNIKVGENK